MNTLTRKLATLLLLAFTGFALQTTATASEADAAPAIEPMVTLSNRVEKIERVPAADGSVESRLVPADQVVPGDELRYTIVFENNGGHAVDAGSVVITNPLPTATEYLNGTAFGAGTEISFSTDGGQSFARPEDLIVLQDGIEVPAQARDYTAIRWVFSPELAPGEKSYVSFNVKLK